MQNELNFNKELINRFASTHEFCNKDINKFILLLRKEIYPYKHMDSWNKFKTLLPNKEDFYSSLNIECINDTDYRHAKRVFKNLVIKISIIMIYMFKAIHYYLQMHLKIFRNMCLKEYELDPAYFLSLPGLAWLACLKKTGIKLGLLADNNMLLMIKKELGEE